MRSQLFFYLFVLIISAVVAQDETNVMLDSGPIVGTVHDVPASATGPGYSARSFRAIPYAAPPINDLRWSPPQKPTPWTTPRDATQTMTVGCPQVCKLPQEMCPPANAEDCLYLNVYTPRLESLKATGHVPVMVFIHGGAYYQGYAGSPYESFFAANRTGIVYVAMNYRLGLLGFLSNVNLDGNFAISDQRFALQWVQRNIAAFGGDPNQVTIYGESAGAMSVSVHLTTPGSKSLFSKAIMESNPLALPYRTAPEMQKTSDYLASLLNCATTDMACFRGASLDVVMASQETIQDKVTLALDNLFTLMLPFTPVIGAQDMVQHPLYALQSGNFEQVPIMVGSNANEGTLFVNELFKKPIDALEVDIFLTAVFGLANMDRITDLYPKGGQDERERLSDIVTDSIFTCVWRNTTNIMAATMNPWNVKLYAYFFDHVLTYPAYAYGQNYTFCYDKVCHGAELASVFHEGPGTMFNWTQDEETLSVSMVDYWASMARYGDVNYDGTSRPMWQNVNYVDPTPGQGLAMVLQTPQSMMNTTVRKPFCDLFDQYTGYNFAIRVNNTQS